MDEALVSRYWCHMCSQMVSPIMEVEIKCPRCNSGFVEELEGRRDINGTTATADALNSDRALPLWPPILLGMMSNQEGHLRIQREDEEQDLNPDRDTESILQRRRRSSAILRVLQARREAENDTSESESNGDRQREGFILINPFNQAIIVQGPYDSSHENAMGGALGDYLIGPGFDLLLQYLSENDPNRYGTPPAKKEVVEALPTVKIDAETMSCSVCLEDFEMGTEAKEMPCKHKFHCGCIVPWLELHSSCPVCRFQLPAEEGSKSGGIGSSGGRAENGSGGNGRRFWLPVPWPLSVLFSFSGLSESDQNSPATATAVRANGSNGSHADES